MVILQGKIQCVSELLRTKLDKVKSNQSKDIRTTASQSTNLLRTYY